MKKILGIVSYTFLPAKTGGQKSIASFYQTLSKYYKLVSVGTNQNEETKSADYRMYNILSSNRLRYINPVNIFKIKSIIKKEKPDYIQLEHPYLGWLAVVLKKITRTKLIVRSHNIEGLRFKNLKKAWWRLLLSYEGWVHRHADINYFISDLDKEYAIKVFNLSSLNCYTITFGIDIDEAPSPNVREASRAVLLEEHNLGLEDIIIFFNGAFDYSPNLNALHHLVKHIFPILKTTDEKKYKLVVCGKDIPDALIKSNINPDIVYAGFVPDINTYLSGATVFVNPITEGAGIKTKLVEALGYNLNCVSYRTGALGVSKELCGDKLIILDDDDIKGFSEAIVKAANITSVIPTVFYNYFSNSKIMEKIKRVL